VIEIGSGLRDDHRTIPSTEIEKQCQDRSSSQFSRRFKSSKGLQEMAQTQLRQTVWTAANPPEGRLLAIGDYSGFVLPDTNALGP
jgi:hypothetical protein